MFFSLRIKSKKVIIQVVLIQKYIQTQKVLVYNENDNSKTTKNDVVNFF